MQTTTGHRQYEVDPDNFTFKIQTAVPGYKRPVQYNMDRSDRTNGIELSSSRSNPGDTSNNRYKYNNNCNSYNDASDRRRNSGRTDFDYKLTQDYIEYKQYKDYKEYLDSKERQRRRNGQRDRPTRREYHQKRDYRDRNNYKDKNLSQPSSTKPAWLTEKRHHGNRYKPYHMSPRVSQVPLVREVQQTVPYQKTDEAKTKPDEYNADIDKSTYDEDLEGSPLSCLYSNLNETDNILESPTFGPNSPVYFPSSPLIL